MLEKLKNQGLEPLPLSPAEFDRMIARDIDSHIAIVKKAGLTFNQCVADGAQAALRDKFSSLVGLNFKTDASSVT